MNDSSSETSHFQTVEKMLRLVYFLLVTDLCVYISRESIYSSAYLVETSTSCQYWSHVNEIVHTCRLINIEHLFPSIDFIASFYLEICTRHLRSKQAVHRLPLMPTIRLLTLVSSSSSSFHRRKSSIEIEYQALDKWLLFDLLSFYFSSSIQIYFSSSSGFIECHWISSRMFNMAIIRIQFE
jgi:hypothetical protein